MKSRKKLLAILMAAVMALTSITVALAVTTADNVKTEGFEMPDKALLQAFLDSDADANEDGTLTVAEMEDVTSLYADWYEDTGREKIQNLSGIEVAKNLEQLYLSDNAIEDITPLKVLKNLEDVNLEDNPVSSDLHAHYSLMDALTEDITIHMMQGENWTIDNSFVRLRGFSDYYQVINVEISLTNGLVFVPDTIAAELIGKEAGEYHVTVTFWSPFGDEEWLIPLVKEMTVVVHALEAPVTEVSNNIPELGDWVGLTYYNEDNNNDYVSEYGDGLAALYPSGELYYIDRAQEIQLSDRAKEYDYVYAGNSIYPNQINILEQDGALWNWRWEKGAAQPEKTRVAENIAQISGFASVDTTGTLWIADKRLENVTDVTGLTENAQYILKSDGTVWKNAYDYYKNPQEFKEGHYEQIDQDVKSLIDLDNNPSASESSYAVRYFDAFYVKNDNTTWMYRQDHTEKIAGFSITDIAINNSGNLFAVDESSAVWRMEKDNPSDCTKIGESFCNWNYFHTDQGFLLLTGFRAQDGRCFDCDGDEIEDNLHPDGSLWVGDEFQILSSVEDFRNWGYQYPAFMTRSDGSIWSYIKADKHYPVMIIAPIDKEPLPTYTLGDVNLDGKVNTSDARLALRGAAKLEALTPQQILAADVNKNGKADTSDARKILRVAAKLDQF